MNNDPFTGIVFGAFACAFGLMMAFAAATGDPPSRKYRLWDIFLTRRTPTGEKNYRLLWTGVVFAIIGAYICIQQLLLFMQ